MAITNFEELVEKAKEVGPKHIAVAAAHDREMLVAVSAAQESGIATAHLVGDWSAIEALMYQQNLDLTEMTIIHEPDDGQAARRVVALAREGQADVVVKGQLPTSTLLKAVLKRGGGLRTHKLLTHVSVYQIPGIERFIYWSDSGVVMYPTVQQKLDIIQGAVDVAHKLGLTRPKVAILAASETVSPKIPSTSEALTVAEMARQGLIEGAVVDGPLALDTALSIEAARLKGIDSPVAGRADILIAPNLEAGNIAGKGILYFAKARIASLAVGATVPVIITSRAESADTRFLSLAMGVLMAGE